MKTNASALARLGTPLLAGAILAWGIVEVRRTPSPPAPAVSNQVPVSELLTPAIPFAVPVLLLLADHLPE